MKLNYQKLLLFMVVVLVLLIGFGYKGLFATNGEEIKVVALKDFPATKQGAIWDIKNHEVKYISTMQLITYKALVLEGGYVDPAGIVGVISYQIFALKDLGFDLPILDYIEFNIGFGGGLKYITDEKSEWFYGTSLTLINVKF